MGWYFYFGDFVMDIGRMAVINTPLDAGSDGEADGEGLNLFGVDLGGENGVCMMVIFMGKF